MNGVVFPLAAAVNFFSVTALIIIAGLSGRHELAADIGVMQAAIMAAFLALSANARSLVLSASDNNIELCLLVFRGLMVVPAIMLSYWLSIVVAIPQELIVCLILRKLTEWFADLELAGSEKRDKPVAAYRYLALNISGWLLVVSTMLFMSDGVFYACLFLWASLPLFGIYQYIKGLGIERPKLRRDDFKHLLPHLGSSSVIGICTYIFRVVLVMLVGKSSAGGLFAAFAIGGVISSIYTYALGPSIIAKSKSASSSIILYFVAVLLAIGVAVLVITSYGIQNYNVASFNLAWGYSVIGGALMLIAQDYRLKVIQKYKEDTFVPDALANMLIILIVPFVFYGLGKTYVTMLYLFAGGLNLVFFSAIFHKERVRG